MKFFLSNGLFVGWFLSIGIHGMVFLSAYAFQDSGPNKFTKYSKNLGATKVRGAFRVELINTGTITGMIMKKGDKKLKTNFKTLSNNHRASNSPNKGLGNQGSNSLGKDLFDQGSNSLIAEYLNNLKIEIEKNLNYPLLAKRLGKEGKVLALLSLNQKGEFLKIETDPNSGEKIFRESALSTLRKMEKFKPLPEDIKTENLLIRVPISFNLERESI